ncbi:OprD family outer membrane porin [Acinetobacter pseudolwoffii]|uniref:OprD family outer membrane porin n=1 Tax=Acinetobacter pseudolwoffii TaxID=2053287 RepID=UPI000C23DBDF|nr:OprD family outer membrane porin [Acinetobacter pseudolwoffii]PJI30358.1 outer membrane porin, OprD family [Acinetobacter pseudolwoffii]
MQNSKKLTLAVLIQAALVSTAFASEQSESKGFVEDAEGSVLFRTGYISRDYKDTTPGSDRSSFAQTAIVKLDSGFTKGTVGFGAGIIGDASFKLGENGHTGNGMIPTHPQNNADGTKDAYDHWTRGGAYVKARVSNTTATYGTQVLDLPVLASNTARLVPEYFTGVLVESNEIENLNLVAGKFTENQYSNQINSDGNELDRAVVWGAKYTFNDDLNASYYGVDVKDKLDRHYVNANYSYALANESTLTHSFSGYHTEFEAGSSSNIETLTEDKQNSIWAISSTYSKDVHNVMLAYQQNTGSLGYDYGNNADGAQSIYLPNSYLSDFIGKDEKSLGLQYNYNFKNHGLAGLNWTSAFVYGWDIDVLDNEQEGQEREFFNQVKYTVQSGFAKDASLRVRHSYYRANDSYKSIYMNDTNEWRIWLDIPVKLF